MRKSLSWLFGRSKSEEVRPEADVEQPTDPAPPPEDRPSRSPSTRSAASAGRSRRKLTSGSSGVLRSSVVDPGHCAIPPVPHLVLRRDTADRISRVMEKLDALELDSPELQRKHV